MILKKLNINLKGSKPVMKLIKKSIIFIMLITFIAAFSGCSEKVNNKEDKKAVKTETKTTYPLTISDSNGDKVTIDKEPKKIVSVAPNITETVFALGKGDELVGRTSYCDYPEAAKKVQDIGSITDPNVEKIIELKPDVVIASTHFKAAVEKKLKALGIKVVVIYDANNFDGVYKDIDTVGEILNAQKKSNEIIAGMKKKVGDVVSKVKDAKKPTVYYVVSFGKSGDYTATGETFIAQMIDMAGGDNIAKDGKNWAYSKEKLIEKEPNIVIVSKYYNTKAQFVKTAGYNKLKAVKDNKVLEIDNNLLDRQGPRIADGLEEMAKLLHPELFK